MKSIAGLTVEKFGSLLVGAVAVAVTIWFVAEPTAGTSRTTTAVLAGVIAFLAGFVTLLVLK